MLLRSESSVAKNGEERPVFQHTTISSLHDDLVLNCLARVSRLHYPTLSLVSKKFRSLITSPEIYKVRSLLGLTESFLYVCLDDKVGLDSGKSDRRWFTLCRRSKKKKKTTQKSSENLLVPIPPRKGSWARVVALGSSIYSIGGIMDNAVSSTVSVLDCRSNTWYQAPNMSVARYCPEINVIDGKIYVIGGRRTTDYDSSNLMEVFDPEIKIWNSLSSPKREIFGGEGISSTMVIDGKICMYGDGDKGVAYNPKNGTCEPIEWDINRAWVDFPHWIVDSVLFSLDRNKKVFKWYDTKERLWRNLNGIEEMMRRIAKNSRVELADYGGKMVVLWDRVGCEETKEIWCGVIAVERRNSGEEEIWGTVEWFGVVLTVPKTNVIIRVVAATL